MSMRNSGPWPMSDERWSMVDTASSIGHRPSDVETFAADVRRDLALTPKQLQSKYLYDAICRLPWYGITRAETRLLGAHAPEIVSRMCPATVLRTRPAASPRAGR